MIDSREPFLAAHAACDVSLCECHRLSVEQVENGEMCDECEHHDDNEIAEAIDRRIRIYFA